MAKRKLSAEQRAELRADLKKSIGGDEKTADVLRRVAKKYGITTITARWYLKSIGGTPKLRAGKRGPGRPPGRKPGRPAGSNGNPSDYLKTISARTEVAKAAKAAGKIIPRWQALLDKESGLRRLALRIERKLEATSQKASELRNRIKELVGA